MPPILRYLATVRRASSMPFPLVYDDFVVGKGVGFVFFFDDFGELGFDGVPGHRFAVGVFSAAGEEHAEGKMPRGFGCIFRRRRGRRCRRGCRVGRRRRSWGGFHELWAVLEEFFLGFDDDAEDAEQRVAALFDGFDKPAGVADIVGDELAGFAVDGLVLAIRL